jgi:hypothetical protein
MTPHCPSGQLYTFIPETLTLSAELAIVFLENIHNNIKICAASADFQGQSTFDLCVYWNLDGRYDAVLVVDGDALLAQLLGMEFTIEEIERCQVDMATSSRPFSLQEATEW